MSAGNFTAPRNDCSSCFIWGGVISEMPWIFSRSGEYPSGREHSAKECHGLLLYGTLLAVEDESFLLGHVEQVDDGCVVVSVIFSIDEHVIVYGQYTGALGHNVIHHHLEDVLGHFKSKGDT